MSSAQQWERCITHSPHKRETLHCTWNRLHSSSYFWPEWKAAPGMSSWNRIKGHENLGELGSLKTGGSDQITNAGLFLARRPLHFVPIFPVGVSAPRSSASLQILAYLAIPDASDAAALSQLSPRSPPFLANRFLSRKICIWGTTWRCYHARQWDGAAEPGCQRRPRRLCLCCPGQEGPRADMCAFVRAFVSSAAWPWEVCLRAWIGSCICLVFVLAHLTFSHLRSFSCGNAFQITEQYQSRKRENHQQGERQSQKWRCKSTA